MNFDRIAPFYAVLEGLTVGRLQQRARVHFLPTVTSARRALLAGEGDGRFLAAALAACPTTRFTVIEASARMLERARHAAGGSKRVEFVHARLPEWEPPAAAYDLVVTNFFFDCFPQTELAPVVAALAHAAAPRADWLVADFRPARSLRQRVLLGLAYAFFRRAAGVSARVVPEHVGLMKAHGFRLLRELPLSAGLLAAEHWHRTSATP